MSADRDADVGSAAREAVEAGRLALSEGSRETAKRWLERACRLAPEDATCLHLLASAVSGTDPRRALRLIETLLTKSPFQREAIISRVALLHRCGKAEEAAAALDALLCTSAVPVDETFQRLAGEVARQGGYAGWLGVTGDGRTLYNAPSASLALDFSPPFHLPAGTGISMLPPQWRRARGLRATSAEGRLLGSMIDLQSIRRIIGAVAQDGAGTLHGWIRRPTDPDTPVLLDIFSDSDPAGGITVAASEPRIDTDRFGAVPGALGFRVETCLLQTGEKVHVRVRHGPALTGSPIRPNSRSLSRRRAARLKAEMPLPVPAIPAGGRYANSRPVPQRHAPIIIRLPASGHTQPECTHGGPLAGMLPANSEFSPAYATPLAEDVSACPLASVNAAMLVSGTNDILILSGAAQLPDDAIGRLADAAYAAPGIGLVMPMTRHAGSAASNPPTPCVVHGDAGHFDAENTILRDVNAGMLVDIPACAGPCVYIRHDCLADTGLFRENAFLQVSTAIQDYALRAACLGWRSVVACDVMANPPEDAGGGLQAMLPATFDLETIECLHPGFARVMEDFAARDPLRPARFAFESGRWATGRQSDSVILVTHASGGGVERHIESRAASLRQLGKRPIVVRPRDGFAVSDGTAPTHPNLVFTAIEDLADFLRGDSPSAVELHHIAAHPAGIERLAGTLRIPFDVVVHDYAAICPRVTLSVAGAYCGEPTDPRLCDDCIADHGALMPFSGTVPALREKQGLLLAAARRVVVPSLDTATRLQRHFPRLRPDIVPWEKLSPPAHRPENTGLPARVAIVGALGVEKGFSVLLACARHAARNALPIHFTLVGHSIDDRRLMDTGRVFVTGRFAEGEGPALLQESHSNLGFLPSIWPETWCYALSTLWQAGLHVLAFDIGAQAERISRGRAGTLMPLGSDPGALNSRMLELAEGQEIRGHG